jgi:hypothetical protein
MGLYWGIFSFLAIAAITFTLFWFIPNGGLLVIACFAYCCHRINQSKLQYGLILGFAFIILFAWFLLPYWHDLTSFGAALYQFYMLIYPKGLAFNWSTYLPPDFWVVISYVISVILICKLILWGVEQVRRKDPNRNYHWNHAVFWSRLFTFIFVIYLALSLIPALAFNIDLLTWIQSIDWLWFIYNLCFVWLPFACIYFFLEYIFSHFGGRRQ